jgi:hypothetical protein
MRRNFEEGVWFLFILNASHDEKETGRKKRRMKERKNVKASSQG